MIPYPVTLGIVVLGVGILDRTIIGKVDYSLLLTFVGFFIFIGNIGRMPAFCSFLQKIIEGREVMTAGGEGALGRHSGQPGDQQCTDSTVAVRFYRKCESIDRWNESGRSGHIDRFYGKPDLL